MLENVTYKSILDIEKLPGKDEVKEFYISKKIEESKADNIAENYQMKVEIINIKAF